MLHNQLEEIKDRCDETMSSIDDLRFNLINIKSQLEELKAVLDDIKRLAILDEKINLGSVHYSYERDYLLEKIKGYVA